MTIFHVRTWRNKLGWSRKVAAEKVGVSVHTIKSYELFRRELPLPVKQLMMRLEQENTQQTKNDSEVVAIGGGFFSEDPNNPITGIYMARPCYGDSARKISDIYNAYDKPISVIFSKMADNKSPYQTSQDLKNLLGTICQNKQISTLYLCCTCLDFDAAEYVKDLRDDITLVSFGEGNPHHYSRSLRADYSFVSSPADQGEGKAYFSYDKQGRTLIHSPDKEACIAGLVEAIMQKEEVYDEEDF